MELKQKLADLRKGKGLTQLELAEMLSVSRQAVSRWEVGTAVPSLDNLVSLSKVYGVPLDELVHGGIDQPDSRKNEPAVSVGGGRKKAVLFRTLVLALCLVVVGALIATAAWKLFREHGETPEDAGRVVISGPQAGLERTPTDVEDELQWLETTVKDLLEEEKTSP